MLKKLVQKIRSSQSINRAIRNRLQKLNKKLENAIAYWPPVGIVNLNFNGIAFKAFSNADDHIVTNLFYNQSYHETSDLKCFLHLAKNSKTIFDIGANTGIYSILSAYTNRTATIYSFEPFSSNIERLKKNIFLNEVEGIEIVPKAVGEKEDVINFTVPESNSISDTSSAIKGFSEYTYEGSLKWKTIQVPQTSLDNFVLDKHLPGIDLIKIDVEGYEVMLFKGAIKTFEQFSPIIQCEIFVDEEKKKFFDDFALRYGYTIYRVMNEGLLRLDEGLTTDRQGLNFLFSKKRLDPVYIPFDRISELIENT